MARDATIVEYSQTCMVLFDKLLLSIDGISRPDPDTELSAQADDQLGRFSIWAGNIGVFATANASLDYRVRDTPQIKDLIIQQLNGLAKFLQRTIDIVQHETWHDTLQLNGAADAKEDDESSASSTSDSLSLSNSTESISRPFPRSSLRKGIKDVEKTISRLYRLSVAIRKSATQSRKTKAAKYVDRDESGHDMSSEFEKYATRLIKQKYPDISQVLCERLGYANSLRRRQFLYRQRHQQKLSLGTTRRVPQGATVLMSGPPVLSPGVGDGAHSLSNDLQSGPSPAAREDGKSALLSQTMASALAIRSIRQRGALSNTSTVITASPVPGSFDVPSAPKMTARAKEFQCPYCFLMLPAKEASHPRWRHHVKKDLEPYICMFEECSEPHKMFSTTADWLTHMQWEHTLQWRCNARGHPPQTFGGEQEFEDHMRLSHAGTFSESQLPVLKRRGAQPASETFFSCPLCGYLPSECSEELGNGKKSEDLPDHVAAHLQDIALVSLPWRGDLEGNASSNTTSPPRAIGSVLGLQDQRSLSSFEDTPPEITDDTEPINEAQVGKPDRGLREHEWAFIMLPHYEGHMTDPILIPFMSKFEQVANFVASVVIQDVTNLTGEIVNYIKDTLGTSELRRKLLKELESVDETLVYMKRRLETAQPGDAFLQKLVGEMAKPVGDLLVDETTLLYKSFTPLRRRLEIIKDGMTPPKPRLKTQLGQKIWPFSEDQTEMFLDDLSIISVHTRSILFHNEFTSSSSGIEDSLSILEETSDRKLYESLSPLDFTVTQGHIFRDSFGNGTWFLETQEFKTWVSGRPWTLYVYGNPGVGKTVLSSIVVHHLQEMSKTDKITVLYMYLDYSDSRQQTLENLFGSLARQLFQDHRSTFPSADVTRFLSRISKDASRPKLKDIISVLRSEIQKLQRVYLIVDALDECDKTTRRGLELQLEELRSSKLSVIITSRCLRVPSNIHIDCDGCGKHNLRLFFHCNICNEGNFDLCQDCVDGQASCRDESHSLSEPYSAVEIDMVTPDEEIWRFVEFRLEGNNDKSSHGDQDERRVRLPTSTGLARICYEDPQLKELISTTIVEKANGNFLIARRYMDTLERQDTVEQVKQLLKTPSDLLDSHYDQIMRRINAQNTESLVLAHKALPWIVHSYRPLVFEELQQAMVIVVGAEDIDLDAFFEIDSLLSVTAGLVTVDSKQAVRLVHQTARTYLDVQGKKLFPSAEIDIALAILSYMRIDAISNPCSGNRDDHEFEARRKSHPFFLYAAVYWGDHVRKVIHDPIIQAAVLRFVRNPSNLASCLQAASWVVPTGEPTEWNPRRSRSSLHECAKFGLTPLIPELLNDGYDIDSQDLTHGLTALMYACQVGYVETVELLLDLGASVSICSVNGTTALFEAVSGGHTDTVELLLKKKDLDINAVYAGHTQRTVLMIAARNDAEEVVRCLLQRVDMDINKADASGSTALLLAAAEGHTSVVSLLLDDESIDPNSKDNYGHTPLSWAAKEGHVEVVKQLLAKIDVDPNSRDNSDQTPLSWAAANGHVEVVQLLLARVDVDLNSKNRYGGTALSLARRNKNDEVVRLLRAKANNTRTYA